MKEPQIFSKMEFEELASFQAFVRNQRVEPQRLKFYPETDSFQFTVTGGTIRRSILEILANTIISKNDIEL